MQVKRALARAGYYTAPAFLIIGAEKAGTTALHKYLGLHPQIVKRKKEIRFFDRDYARGLAWYHSHFPLPYQMHPGQVTFEATPDYLFLPQSPERIFRYDSHIKLIALLRNPIERALSAWNMPRLRVYPDLRAFDEMAREEIARLTAGDSSPLINDFRFVERGLYYEQLVRFFALFPREQILILESAAMKRDTEEALRKVTGFLTLPDFDWDAQPKLAQPYNVGAYAYAASVHPETRAQMVEFYRPYNEKLYELLRVDYGWE
jgi:hypothetical protein